MDETWRNGFVVDMTNVAAVFGEPLPHSAYVRAHGEQDVEVSNLELLRNLTEKCPTDNPNDGLGYESCGYCGCGEWGSGWRDPKSHEDDCPWIAAVTALQ